MLMKIIVVLLIIFQIFESIITVQAQQSEETCITPDKYYGTCKKLSECPEIEELVSTIDLRKYQKNCNSDTSNDPIVCCKDIIDDDIYFPNDDTRPLKTSTTTSSTITNDNESLIRNNKPGTPKPSDPTKVPILDYLPDPSHGCGRANASFNRVVGGQPAQLGAWPWIALMGYKNDFDEIEWRCGGSLITQKHVLTAAHCIRKDLYAVRLGEHDLSKTTETKHIDVLVDKWVRHKDYSYTDGHADIAVVSLKNPVPLSRFILPICLPKTETLRSQTLVGLHAFVAGWGKTQENGRTANVLQQLQIKVFDNSECSVYYKSAGVSVSGRQFDSSVVCAGVLAGKKDVCDGDSGGPLMFAKSIDDEVLMFQMGTISFGHGCARPKLPSVFMSISHYYDWIEDNVRNL